MMQFEYRHNRIEKLDDKFRAYYSRKDSYTCDKYFDSLEDAQCWIDKMIRDNEKDTQI